MGKRGQVLRVSERRGEDRRGLEERTGGDWRRGYEGIGGEDGRVVEEQKMFREESEARGGVEQPGVVIKGLEVWCPWADSARLVLEALCIYHQLKCSHTLP